ncbi:MAG: hypothetical protein M5U19_10635 [Microthrixaceae bacterium]|nr:hypothetical protein [Microthrixaceae bacterium]
MLYMEGYLFDEPEAQEAFRVAAGYAHDAGRIVSATLSDSFCVERHHGAFTDLVRNHLDLVFANEAEVLALYRTDDFEVALGRIRDEVPYAALTRSEKGSVVVTPDEGDTRARRTGGGTGRHHRGRRPVRRGVPSTASAGVRSPPTGDGWDPWRQQR